LNSDNPEPELYQKLKNFMMNRLSTPNKDRFIPLESFVSISTISLKILRVKFLEQDIPIFKD